MLDEVSLVVVESLPILDIGGKIDLFRSPESSHLVLVHLPDVAVSDGQDDEPVGVVFQERLWEGSLSLGEVAVLRLEIVIVSIGRGHLRISRVLRLLSNLVALVLAVVLGQLLLVELFLSSLGVVGKDFRDFLLVIHDGGSIIL